MGILRPRETEDKIFDIGFELDSAGEAIDIHLPYLKPWNGYQ